MIIAVLSLDAMAAKSRTAKKLINLNLCARHARTRCARILESTDTNISHGVHGVGSLFVI